ncbi:MAG TPA: DUF5916 domain-containing protein, partial [Gemmatimonadaceae bacterium]|nr:DUF5916 domain-containing protein [Gemmatimonadaceae bacterium]
APLRLLASLLVACAALAAAPPAAAQQPAAAAPPAPELPLSHAVRARGVIHVDGKLDERAWADAPVTDRFTQIDPSEGQPASQRAEVRVLYDDDALYVGARLHDAGPVTARLGRRDGPLGDSDWFGVMIDSYHDHRTAFGFDVNPLGVRRDEIKTIDEDDNSWDAVWEVATSVDADGWTAEYRIPFSQLRFGSATEQTWGVQFERIIGRNHEYAVSTFIPKAEQGGVPRYGHLDGLRDVRPGKRLEVLPYTVTKAEYVDRGPDPFKDRNEYGASVGADVLYRVSSNFTLNATFNPDFGQVELDPAVVNLGVYETFYEEKRPFFVEGSEIFAFGANGTSGGQLFYSRRIGRAPSLGAPTPRADLPDVTTILGAAKLSGKTAGWSIGALEAVTDREQARYLDDANVERRFAVEPLSNYAAARARRDMRGGQSFVGVVATAVNRRLDSDPLAATLRSAAYAGGVDFRHEWGNRTWAVYGDAELSDVHGSPGAITATQLQSNHYFQRPDATHLELDPTATSLTGYSVNVAVGKQAGRHWRGSLAAAATSPKYEVNDIGFSYRTDRRDGQAVLTYVENTPGAHLRRWNTTGSFRSEHNFAWQPILTVATLGGSAQTAGYWSTNYNVQRFFRALDDRLTRGGPLVTRPAWWSGNAGVSSDGRKPVTVDVGVGGSDYESGAWDWNAGIGLGLKTSTWWNLRVGPSVTRVYSPVHYVGATDDAAYTATYGRRYVFAPLHYTEVGLETRLNVTFSPALSLETYVQPLLSGGDFGQEKQLVAPRTYDFTALGTDASAYDFNFRSLRGNAVLRWEWRPGSTMYVAWQQRRADYADGVGDFDIGRDQRALMRTRPDNVFLVKVNYWLNP